MQSKAARDILEMAGTLKKKAYIPTWMVRQYCPQAKRVTELDPLMQSFEVLYDSVAKFFRTNPNIKRVYIDEKANQYRGGDIPEMYDHTTYVIKCSFY